MRKQTRGQRRETLQPGSRRNRARRLFAGMAALALLAVASPAAAEEYDETYAGHPLRVVAYVVHPVGVILNYLIFRPFHWIGSHEPFKTLSGQKD